MGQLLVNIVSKGAEPWVHAGAEAKDSVPVQGRHMLEAHVSGQQPPASRSHSAAGLLLTAPDPSSPPLDLSARSHDQRLAGRTWKRAGLLWCGPQYTCRTHVSPRCFLKLYLSEKGPVHSQLHPFSQTLGWETAVPEFVGELLKQEKGPLQLLERQGATELSGQDS